MSPLRFLFGYKVEFICGGILYQRSGVHGWHFSQRSLRDGTAFDVVYLHGRDRWDVKACIRLDDLTAIGGELAEHPDFFERPWGVEEPESEEARTKRFLALKGITGTGSDDPKLGQF